MLENIKPPLVGEIIAHMVGYGVQQQTQVCFPESRGKCFEAMQAPQSFIDLVEAADVITMRTLRGGLEQWRGIAISDA
jgi:hypothetical protein